MKLSRISTHILESPLGDQRFYSSQAVFPVRKSLIVRIESADGAVGWGEGGQYGPSEPVASVIDEVLAPMLLGRDVTGPVPIWDELYSFSRDFGQMGTYIEAMSAIDIALWDLFGKAVRLPVHTLLGGSHRTSVRAYATGGYYGEDFHDLDGSLGSLASEAAGYVTDGFSIFKMKIGMLPIADDARRVATVRSAVGEDIALLVDANHAYTSTSAIRMGRKLEEQGVLWLEEPVVPEDRVGYRRVREKLDLAIAGGEAAFTRYGFKSLIEDECVDIVQPDICVAGGLSEFLKIQTLASSANLLTIPHVWGSGVAVAAALQGIATIPPTPHTFSPVPLANEPVIEFDRKHNPLRDTLLVGNFELVDGYLPVPDGPGLGIEVDESVLRQFEV